jgi:alkylation response protein AidB-like acyl-CoA dehydrogenase
VVDRAFALSDEHEEFRAAIRRFAEKEIAPHAAEADQQEAYPQASFDAYRDSGFVRSIYPEEHGGDGGDTLTYALVVEELARVCASSSLFALISRLGITALLLHGSDELKRRYVPRIASGEWQASYCLSEAHAGSDVASMSTRAVRDGDHYVLTGRKAWITNAGVSVPSSSSRAGPASRSASSSTSWVCGARRRARSSSTRSPCPRAT